MTTKAALVLDVPRASSEAWARPKTLPLILAAVALVALVIRVIWIWRYGNVIENEGTAYARLAESLRDGEGYIGVLGGRQTLMPPLSPLLLILMEPLAGSIEAAARVLSCIAGVATLFPAYAIASRLAGQRAGLIAAGLVATHGVTIGFSGATYGEGTFFFLLLSATALLLRAAERPSVRAYAATGVVYGLAYLLRPEAIAYTALAVVFVVGYNLVERRPIGAAIRGSAVLLLLFAVVIAPYVAWLSLNSGYLRLEGKSLYNGWTNDGMSRGMLYHEAAQQIGPDLEPVGSALITDQFDIPRLEQSGLVFALQTVLFDPINRGLAVAEIWATDSHAGGPLLALLAVIGGIAVLVRRRDLIVGVLLLCMTGGYAALILAVRWYDWDRYIYPLTFFALLWAAAGVGAVAALGGKIAASLGGAARAQLAAQSVTAVLCVSAVSLVSLAGNAPVFYESHMPAAETMKSAGLWIREQGSERHPVIMSANAIVAYYAQGDLTLYPWAESSRALQFIHKRAPDYLVLRTSEGSHAPYLESWLANGIPDDCATEIRRAEEEPGQELVVYRWTCRTATN